MNYFTRFLSKNFYSFWEHILLGIPLSGCFRANAAGFLKPTVVMLQGLRTHVMCHTSEDTYLKTWYSLSRILSRFYNYMYFKEGT